MNKKTAIDLLMELRNSLIHGSKYIDKAGRDRTSDVIAAIGVIRVALPETENNYMPDRIIRNGRATVIYWTDGTKTVVKKSEEQEDDPYSAFCAAVAKKIYDTNSRIKRILEKKTAEQKEPGERRKKK